jgi:acyl-CoA reductase-like NAD-dependent aldehyde dehydrogenase
MTQDEESALTLPVPDTESSESTRGITSFDPRDGLAIARYPVGRDADVERLVEQARQAARWWVGLGHAGRRKRLDAWRRLIVSRLDEVAALISAETGKTPGDARAELVLALDHLHWAAQHARRVLRRRRRLPGMLMSNHSATVDHVPYGVVGVIGPWNFPVFTPMGSIAYALAAGNVVIFKPSEYTPGVGQWLADTFAEVVGDRPVLSVLTGDGVTGEALCQAAIDKLAFTGSAATGRRVMAACAQRLTPVLMECGGKDPLIVDADADLKAAAEAAVWGAMANAGQACMAVERVYVHRDVAEPFLAHVRHRCARLRPGPDAGASFGPITMPAQLDIVTRHVESAVRDGGRLFLGGPESITPPYVHPVVLVDVPEHSVAMREETFGPVLIVNAVASMDEAVDRTNASTMGLGASIFGRRDVTRIAAGLRVGMISVNSVMPIVAMPTLPFGGVGDSGFGRIHGEEGLKEFARTKAIARQRFAPALRVLSFDRPAWTIDALVRLAKLLYGR